MHPSRVIKTFSDRYPFVGPTIWMLSIQYFVIQIVVASAWKFHYSLAHNAISDLGNTACGIYSRRPVCSPLHSLMNVSFITLGAFMAAGAMLIYREFKKTHATLIGFTCLALAGLGTIMVGLFPENTRNTLHVLGASMPFLVGNVGLVILSIALAIPKPLRIYTFITGAISLIALVFLVAQQYLGLGLGGVERLVAYPQTIWFIIFGMYISRNHLVAKK